MKWLIRLILMLSIPGFGQAHAESSLSVFDQIRYLRFGNEKHIELQNGTLDLRSLTDDQYFRVTGSLWYFDGEWIDPKLFASDEGWSQLLEQKKPILVEINQKFQPIQYQQIKNPKGTYAFRVTSIPDRRLSLQFFYEFQSVTAFFVSRDKQQILSQYGSLDPKFREVSPVYFTSYRNPSIHLLSSDNFTIVSHMASSALGRVTTPNISSFMIGEAHYLDNQVRNSVSVLGAIVGSFLLASIFYLFIFAFRPSDRSSLYLCLYALLAFFTGMITFNNHQLGAARFSLFITTANICGFTCFKLFIVEKIKPFASRRTVLTFTSAIYGLCILGLSTQFLGNSILSSILYIIILIEALFLMATGIVFGIRHKISGSGYFILGAMLSTAFQFPILRISLSGLNEDFGFTIILSCLVTTVCLALVNAKDFAITYQKSEVMRQDLQHLLKEVQEKERARTLLFQNTSHELRTPLNGILGFLGLIQKGVYGQIGERLHEQLAKVQNLASSLMHQVNTILDLAKSHRGEMKVVNSLISLDELADEARILGEGLLSKEGHFSWDITKSWQASEHPMFVSDREKLFAIICNLVGNAFKFTEANRPNSISLKLALSDQDRLLELTVKDSGIGIPEDQFSSIFEEFKQVQGDARRSFEGTGLGLAMVKNFVKLLGGTIDLKSKLGEGTEFTVRIPAQAEVHLAKALVQTGRTESIEAVPLAPRAELRPSGTQVPTLPTSKPYDILVIDDNRMNCEVVSDILMSYGFQVNIALGGKEGLQKIRAKRPDLILLDLMMPEVSGEDVIHELKSDSRLKDIPVILLTARASQEDRILGLSLGADDYLAKPLVSEEMMLRVNNTLVRLDLAKASAEKHLLEINLAAAQDVQAKLSRSKSTLPGIEITEYYRPAESTGGDWLAYHFERHSNRLYILIGDVTGHGMSAALVTVAGAGAFKGAIGGIKVLGQEHSMLDCLKFIANAMNEAVLDAGQKISKSMTMAFVCLDLETGAGVYLNAGHSHLSILSEKGVDYCVKGGDPLGHHESPDYGNKGFQLKEGDAIFLYTDGLFENRGPNGEALSQRQLKKILSENNQPETIKREIISTCELLWKDNSPEDDCTFLLVKWAKSTPSALPRAL
jgi:signal transduction histidine kinase/DNA-binding response OmpR family regulator